MPACAGPGVREAGQVSCVRPPQSIPQQPGFSRGQGRGVTGEALQLSVPGKDYKLGQLSSPSTASLRPLPLHFSEMFPLLPHVAHGSQL